MVRIPPFAAALLGVAVLAAACSPDSATGPVARGVAVAPRVQGGATDPLLAPVGLSGTWKGILSWSVLPKGYENMEIKVTQLTDTSFYGVARAIIPQADGSSFTMTNIAVWGKNVGSAVTARIYQSNGAEYDAVLGPTGNTMSGSWNYGVFTPGAVQSSGAMSLAR